MQGPHIMHVLLQTLLLLPQLIQHLLPLLFFSFYSSLSESFLKSYYKNSLHPSP